MTLPLRKIAGLLGSDVVVTMAARIGSQMLSLLAIVVIGRYLSLAEFGSFSLGWLVTVLAVTFLYTGYYQFLLLTKDVERDRDTVFWLLVAASIVFATIILVIALACGWTRTLTGTIMAAFAPMPLLASLGGWSEALLLRRGAMRRVAIGTVLPEIVAFAALLVGLHFGLGAKTLILWRWSAQIASVSLMVGLAGAFPRFGFHRDTARAATHTALPLYGSAATTMASVYGADIVLGLMLNPTAVGTYRAGSRFVAAATDILLRPITTITWSRMSRAGRDENLADMADAWRNNLGFLAITAWPILAVLAILGPELVTTFINPAWKSVGPVLSVLAVAGSLQIFDSFLEPMLSSIGDKKVFPAIRTVSIVLLIGFLLVASPFGPVWAAAAVLAMRAIIAALSVYVLRRRFPISTRRLMMTLAPAVLVSIACAVAVELVRSMSWASALNGLISACAVAAVTWLLLTLPLFAGRRILLPSS